MNPIGDKIIVKPEKMKEKTDGGLFIPPTSKEQQVKGIVEAVGPKVKVLKVGDIVIYPKYEGVKMDWKQEKIIILHEKDVLVVVE